MSLFDMLFGRKKAPKKKVVSKAVKAPAPKASSAPQKLPVKTPVPNRTRQEVQRIETMKGVPGYNAIISSAQGDLPISPLEMLDYIILRLHDGREDIALIRSDEKTKAGVDHSYMTIKERIKEKGLKINIEYVTSREIIKLLYDKQNEGRLDVKNKSEIINKVDILLKDALVNGISDVHIEVRRDEAEVRFRKHGDLYLRHDWPVQTARDVSIVLYQVMAEEKDVTFNPGIRQDAVLDRMLDGKRLRVRIGTLPAAPDGYDMVMRLLPYDEDEVQIGIGDLGYLEEQQLDIEMGLSKPNGVIVIAGVTGSGKTTSLAAMIREIVSEGEGTIKVITVENPPEQFMRNVTQSPVGSKGDYADAMKGALRADPDIIMVGEVRDKDTATLLISAVQSGHKVLTTIHAPSGIGIVGRMRSLGVPNDVLGGGDFFSALIYQTLVKSVCPHCSIPLQEYQEQNSDNVKFEKLLKRLIMTVDDLEKANIRFINKDGCHKCHNGIKGRTVVAEVIIPDHEMISYFASGQDMKAWKHFRDNGGKSALTVGIEKMTMGLVDPYDVERALGLLNAEIVMSDGVLNYQEERIYSGSKPQSSAKSFEEIVESKPDSFVEMDDPILELANASDFSSELLSEQLKSADVIQIDFRKDSASDSDDLLDPSDD